MTALLPKSVRRVIHGFTFVVAVTSAVLIFLAIRDMASPSFRLLKKEWTCSQGHYPLRENAAPTQGSGVLHIPQGAWICDRYDRKLSASEE